MTTPSCRLFVIPARDAHKAVVLRRGPSNWCHVILWNTEFDAFEEGAWFKGRIREHACDLSPDGQLFVYFASKYRRMHTSYGSDWTAVSRPPWLYALTLWPNLTHRGGGRFAAKRKLKLFTTGHRTHPDHPLFRPLKVMNASFRRRPPSAIEIRDSDWSGRDQSDRVIFTRGGKVFRQELAGEIEIADFTNRAPDPQPPPDWAKQPV